MGGRKLKEEEMRMRRKEGAGKREREKCVKGEEG